MTGKIKRRSLRCGGRPKADFGSIFTTFIAPALGVAGSVADSAISKAQVSKSNIKPAVKEPNTEVNNNTSVENLPTTQAPTKDPISGLVTSNTVIPPDPTKTPTMRLGGRKKCWIGAAIMGATSIAGSLFGAAAQKREMRRQKSIQDWQNTTQEAANMTTTLNNSQDYQEDYLRQFRTAARLGKTLGAKGIYITDGGDATKIGSNTYLLRGGSHEDVNETGQTGIGINVGGNEVEAEGGEVAQKKNGALRIFSAQPILGNGMSPAQAILRGYNKDKVFSQQQAFKKRNGLKDDGSKAAFGNLFTIPFSDTARKIVEYFSGTGRYASKPVKITPKTVAKKPIRNGQVGNFRVVNGRRISNEKPLRRVYPEFDIISMGRGLPVGKAAKATARAAKNEVSYINRISKSRLYSDNPIVNTYATYARRYKLPDKARLPYLIRRIKSDEFPKVSNNKITLSGNRFPHTNFTYDRPVVSHNRGKWDTAQQTYLINGRKLIGKNKGNWGSIEPSDMFTVRDPKEGLTVPTKDVILVSGHKGVLSKAKASGIKTATSPQLQRREESVTPRESLGRFNLAGGERRHYNTPYWLDVNNIVKEYGTPKLKDVRLLEELTGLKSGVTKLDNKAMKIINDANRFDKLKLNEAEEVMNQTYPNGRHVKFTNDRESYVTGQFPYNNLFYDPTTYAESNYVFPKRLGGRCKLRNGGLTSKDRGSSKHPYPSVSSKDFAGGGRSYPIPTKADAVDALRLAGLHGRSDVRSKVYTKYPELRKKARGGAEVDPYYDWARNTSANLGISFIDPTYDYRAYYNSVTPYERNLVRFAPQGTHFTDIGKTPNHPTFSNESKYSNKKTPGGTWNRNVFVPAIWQFGNNGNKVRNRYMNNSGEGYFNGRNNVFPLSRKRHSLGGRPKAFDGMFVPFNKRYTSIYDAPDYNSDYNGGNVLGNGEVTITAKRIKPTFMKPNNDAMNIINHPASETPYIPQHHNRSRTIFSGGDYLGLGIDTLAALSTGLVNYNTAGKYTLPDRTPIIQASKLPTTYNVNPEIEEVKRYRDRLTGQTFNNTSSSVAALNRSGAINLDALSNLSKLWATKENEENKMLTQDALNQQTVATQNVQNELARQSEIARIKNEATQAKGDALNVGLSGLSQAWTNFWTAGRTAYEDDQTRRAMIASSKEATPTRLSEMDFDLSPDILASLYRTAKDDRTKRFYLSRLSPKQRLKYGIN